MMISISKGSGALIDEAEIERLMAGRCALCGRAHTGFGREPRNGVSLAACACGAMYHFSGGPQHPRRVSWYRAQSR